jgi:hypothetical protein
MFVIKLDEHTQFKKLKPMLFTFIKNFKHSNSLEQLKWSFDGGLQIVK